MFKITVAYRYFKFGLLDSGLSNEDLDMTPKAQETKGVRRMSWTSPKLKTSKDITKTVKKTIYKTGENICNSYLTKVQGSEYIKNSYNSTT